MKTVFDTADLISFEANNVRHYTDGKRYYIEVGDSGIIEYVGPLSEAPADVIETFLTENKS